MKVAVVGASGFVGSAVVAACGQAGWEVLRVSAPRVAASVCSVADVRVEVQKRPDVVAGLTDRFADCDAVVNAAGCAEALSSDQNTLRGANAVVPGLLVAATRAADVRRFVHISSVAVQGRRAVLDESTDYDPFSPYATSKILGEQVVLDAAWDGAVVYRPTSVHGPSRGVTLAVARVARSSASSVAGSGDRSTPQVLVSSVGSAVAFLAREPSPIIVMHPWEGLTTASVLTLLGEGRTPRRIPVPIARAALWFFGAAARLHPGAQGLARRLEMLWFGQAQADSWLTGAGWTGTASREDWLALSRQLSE